MPDKDAETVMGMWISEVRRAIDRNYESIEALRKGLGTLQVVVAVLKTKFALIVGLAAAAPGILSQIITIMRGRG